MAELGNLAKKSETDLGDPNDNECMDILATSEKKKKMPRRSVSDPLYVQKHRSSFWNSVERA